MRAPTCCLFPSLSRSLSCSHESLLVYEATFHIRPVKLKSRRCYAIIFHMVCRGRGSGREELLEIFTEFSFLFLHFSFLNIFIHIANISCLFLFTLRPGHKKVEVCVWVNTIAGSASYTYKEPSVPCAVAHFPFPSVFHSCDFSFFIC